jgi:uncharacterized DUF497 family protein
MGEISISGLDWDEGNREKCGKHGLSVAPDPKHSGAEARSIAVGGTRAGRAVFVAFTLRVKAGDTFIRAVSARYMHRKEIEAYEKKSS